MLRFIRQMVPTKGVAKMKTNEQMQALIDQQRDELNQLLTAAYHILDLAKQRDALNEEWDKAMSFLAYVSDFAAVAKEIEAANRAWPVEQ
jgi:hypothetical protein